MVSLSSTKTVVFMFLLFVIKSDDISPKGPKILETSWFICIFTAFPSLIWGFTVNFTPISCLVTDRNGLLLDPLNVSPVVIGIS